MTTAHAAATAPAVKGAHRAWLLQNDNTDLTDEALSLAMSLRRSPDALLVVNSGDQPRVVLYAADRLVDDSGHDTVVEVPAMQGFMLVLLDRKTAVADVSEMVRAHERSHLTVHRRGVSAEAFLAAVPGGGWRWRSAAGEHAILDATILTALLKAILDPVLDLDE